MNEINVIERRLVPEKPKVIAKEQIEIYVPVASYTNPGVAAYNAEDFVLDSDVVKLKYNEEYYRSRIPTTADLKIDDSYRLNLVLYNYDGKIVISDTVDLKLKQVLSNNATMIAQNASDIQGLRNDFKNEEHFRGWVTKNSGFETLKGDTNDFAYSAESGTVWVYNDDVGWEDSGEKIPGDGGSGVASNDTPLMDGTPTAGVSDAYARGDHRHPSDNNKLDKVTTATGGYRVYGISDTGAQTTVRYASGAVPNVLALRNSAGNLVSNDPTVSNEVATKNYADTNFVAKNAPKGTAVKLYGETSEGSVVHRLVNTAATPTQGTIPIYRENGTLSAGTPTELYHATNKEYVDDGFLAKTTVTSEMLLTQKVDGSTDKLGFDIAVKPYYIVRRDSNGDVLVNDTPSSKSAAVNQKYVDDAIAGVGGSADLSDYVKKSAFNSSYGMKISNGYVMLNAASESDITTGTNTYKGITPARVDFLVKKGITASKLTLSDTEKAKAQAWLGISGGLYKHIFYWENEYADSWELILFTTRSTKYDLQQDDVETWRQMISEVVASKIFLDGWYDEYYIVNGLYPTEEELEDSYDYVSGLDIYYYSSTGHKSLLVTDIMGQPNFQYSIQKA